MKTVRNFLYLLLLLTFLGCASSARNRPVPLASHPSKPPVEVAPTVERAPWDLWSYGQDLDGQSIVDDKIRQGDEYLQKGDYATAYQIYSSINRDLLTPSSKSALVVRVGSTLLSLVRRR